MPPAPPSSSAPTPLPSPLRGVGKVILFVSDVRRAVAFYRDALGLPVRLDTPDWVELDGGGVTLALHGGVGARPAGGPPPYGLPHVQVAFAVASVAAAHAALVGRGVAFVHGPRPIAPGVSFARLDDPDGHALSISGPA